MLEKFKKVYSEELGGTWGPPDEDCPKSIVSTYSHMVFFLVDGCDDLGIHILENTYYIGKVVRGRKDGTVELTPNTRRKREGLREVVGYVAYEEFRRIRIEIHLDKLST